MSTMLQIGEWYFKVRKTRTGDEFIAWCAKTSLLGNGPLQVGLDEDVFCQFGRTEQEALDKLKREVLN